MVYIYSYSNNPNGSDPCSEPWVFGGGNDIHAIRADSPGSWSYVPHAMSQPGEVTRGLSDAHAYWNGNVPGLAYCCCKGK